MPARIRRPDSNESRNQVIPEARRNHNHCNFSKTVSAFLTIKTGDKKMTKVKYMFFTMLALALTALPAMAQSAADNESTVASSKALAAGIGFGIAAGLAGIGQGLVGSRAAEGAARNPGAASSVQTIMIIALALIESLVLFALVIVFAKL
jgi:F-type H+-transporting ATPase subunit c